MVKKIECPICDTLLPASSEECPVCGAHVADLIASEQVEPQRSSLPANRSLSRRIPHYNSAIGEDDLFAPHLLRFPWWGIVLPALFLGLLVLAGSLLAGVALSQQIGPRDGQASQDGLWTAVPTLLPDGGGAFQTLLPTLDLPTLTATRTPSVTPTPSPTPGPCEQTVQAGDTLIMLAMRCGHQDLAILDEIVDLNGLRSAESLQQGQLILIPWPTPTPGAAPTEASTSDDGSDTSAIPSGTSATVISDVIPTATLQPGVMWYVVQPGDNILKVAIQFNANVEILSQLNPEVTFSQCDFGMDSGGPNCIVQLAQGQYLRVPAPTPTPTLSPTPSGSETPTPTSTATFNAPSLHSPGDRFLFDAEQLVSLRWVTTGTLGDGDVYLLTVTDTTIGATYTATTRETLHILPEEWQPQDGQRHMYTWNVAVGPSNGLGGLASVTFTTPSRMFFWDSR